MLQGHGWEGVGQKQCFAESQVWDDCVDKVFGQDRQSIQNGLERRSRSGQEAARKDVGSCCTASIERYVLHCLEEVAAICLAKHLSQHPSCMLVGEPILEVMRSLYETCVQMVSTETAVPT